MILAQNLLPQLSGNNWYKLLIIVVFIGACTPLKPVSDGDGEDDELDEIVNEFPDKKDDSDVIVIGGDDDKDNKTDTTNPKDPQNPTDPTNTKGGNVDNNNNEDNNTGDDSNNSDGNDGIVIIDPNDNNTNDGNNDSYYLKSTYDVSILMPLQADAVNIAADKMPRSAVRGMNFYEGSLLALQQLSAEGINLNVSVYDTKRSPAVVQALIDNQSLSAKDLIIGPASTENLRIVANAMQATNTPIVSLNLNSRIASEHPNYIQASPYFNSHAEAIIKYVKSKYPNRTVVLAAPSEGSDANRFSAYQNANALTSNDGILPIKEYIEGKADKSTYKFTSIQNYLTPGDTTIFIVPSSNQEYVSGLMRTLSLTRKRFPVVMFGMPKWLSFEKIDYQYYENLNVHISTSTHINKLEPNTRSFAQQFFTSYGMFPTSEAYKGYDLMLYFGRMLHKYGTDFLNKLDSSPAEHLHSRFAFERIPVNTGVIEEGNYKIKQYENKYVNILRFRDFYFQRVNPAFFTETVIDPTRN